MGVFLEIDKGNPFDKPRYDMRYSITRCLLPVGRLKPTRDESGRLKEIPHAKEVYPWRELAIETSLSVNSKAIDSPSVLKFADLKTGADVLVYDERDLPDDFTFYHEMSDGKGQGGMKIYKAKVTSNLPRR
jgi:hypothetical protein